METPPIKEKGNGTQSSTQPTPFFFQSSHSQPVKEKGNELNGTRSNYQSTPFYQTTHTQLIHPQSSQFESSNSESSFQIYDPNPYLHPAKVDEGVIKPFAFFTVDHSHVIILYRVQPGIEFSFFHNPQAPKVLEVEMSSAPPPGELKSKHLGNVKIPQMEPMISKWNITVPLGYPAGRMKDLIPNSGFDGVYWKLSMERFHF